LTMAQTRGSPRFVGEQRSNQRFTIDLVGLCPPAPARRCNRGRVDDVAFHAFALERPVNPKPVKTGLLYNDDPKALTRPQPRLLLKLCEALQQPAHIAAMHCCFDIFSPPPGDSEVISQLDRLNSSETKIAPRSVRIAVGASSWSVVMFMVSSKIGGGNPPPCPGIDRYLQHAMGSRKGRCAGEPVPRVEISEECASRGAGVVAAACTQGKSARLGKPLSVNRSLEPEALRDTPGALGWGREKGRAGHAPVSFG